MHLSRALVPILLAYSAACGGPAEAPKPKAPAADKVQAAPEDAKPLGDLDPKELEAEADVKGALVPSPVETEAALAAAGISAKLATMVPERTFKLDEVDSDRVAVRTGVVIADMLLTVKTSSDEQLVAQLSQVKQGMATLDAGKDIDVTLADTIDRVKAGTVARDELLTELDELSSVVVPELEFNGVARIVPLIQAGSWLNGANLVAKAAKAEDKAVEGGDILKQPAVVAYFQQYAKDKAEGAVPSMVANTLDSSLAELHAVANGSEPLTNDHLDTVISSTDAVLALL